MKLQDKFLISIWRSPAHNFRCLDFGSNFKGTKTKKVFRC